MEAATLWIAFVSAVGTGGAAIFAGFAMANSAKAEAAAAKSATRAEKAQAQALDAWKASAAALEQANSRAERAARAPLGHALNDLGKNILSARFSRASELGRYPGRVEEAAALGPLQFAAGHPSARKVTRWVGEFAESVPLRDPASMLGAMSLIGDRVRDWVADPDSTMTAIRADPKVPESAITPGDSAEWRVE
ncbi:hypothetical protein GCM10022381_27660 [Leifsonia kafniensis]|uniref:Uncharacterized protein n=1 Tax=Leifsonia kafniensis TaxID=475957 RepID=A0ABP7KRZ3_9MICO